MNQAYPLISFLHLLYGFLEGKSIEDSLTFANKAASYSVTQIGTTIVNRSDIK